mgnify:CR=1 FL=1
MRQFVKLKSFLILLFLLIFRQDANAQTVPVGMPVLEEYYRRIQLNGQLDSTISFTVRPLFSNFNPDSLNQVSDSLLSSNSRWFKWAGIKRFKDKPNTKIQLLPGTWDHIYTSRHPFG